jgi:hypothetical protein
VAEFIYNIGRESSGRIEHSSRGLVSVIGVLSVITTTDPLKSTFYTTTPPPSWSGLRTLQASKHPISSRPICWPFLVLPESSPNNTTCCFPQRIYARPSHQPLPPSSASARRSDVTARPTGPAQDHPLHPSLPRPRPRQPRSRTLSPQCPPTITRSETTLSSWATDNPTGPLTQHPNRSKWLLQPPPSATTRPCPFWHTVAAVSS